MKIAIFHNFLDNIGGAEHVVLTMAKELNADIYTTNIDREKIEKMGFSSKNIFSIGRVPISAPFRQELTSWRFRFLNLGKKYDFYIIGGDWAMSAAVNHKPNLWYVHSPTREIWDLREYVRSNIVSFWARPVFDIWTSYRRYLNLDQIKHVENIVTNSDNVRNRVKKFLKRESRVITPSIETRSYHYEKSENFWLSVNRLFYHKRVELQIEAFRNLPDEKLIIVGSYERSSHFERYADNILKNKPDNVEILSWVDNKDLVSLYSRCKGFITSAIDEDFGLTVLEAMASGKPVIAPNEGGYKETVVDGITGVLVDDMDVDKLVEAIKKVGINVETYKESCISRAREFDTTIFIRKLKRQLYAK